MIQQLPAMPRLRALTRFPADSRVMVYPQTVIVNCSFLLHPAKNRRFLLYLSIQGSQSEPLRRVRVACKATSSFPHACASYNPAKGIPLRYILTGSRRAQRRKTSPPGYESSFSSNASSHSAADSETFRMHSSSNGLMSPAAARRPVNTSLPPSLV